MRVYEAPWGEVAGTLSARFLCVIHRHPLPKLDVYRKRTPNAVDLGPALKAGWQCWPSLSKVWPFLPDPPEVLATLPGSGSRRLRQPKSSAQDFAQPKTDSYHRAADS